MTDAERKKAKQIERERKRQEAREHAEKKRKFGLTPEKKRKLKLLIMKIATENLKYEAEKKLAAKKAFMDQNVPSLQNPDSMNEANLVSLIKDFHNLISNGEEQKYDLEMKIRKQDYEVTTTTTTTTIQL
jgi:hypothetical protein